MKKFLLVLACVMIAHPNQLPSALEQFPSQWQDIELVIDPNLNVKENTVSCQKDIWMGNAKLACDARRVREGWLIQLKPTNLFDGDTLIFLIPNDPAIKVKFLGIHFTRIAFMRFLIPITSGSLILKSEKLVLGESVNAVFNLNGEHSISGTLSQAL